MRVQGNAQAKHGDVEKAAKRKAYDMAYIGFFVVVIAICSWITIPAAVPFTLQTFAVFLSVILLGGRRGTLAVAVYILLGAIGIPVFSGCRGGIGVLMNSTGGYLVGFLCSALIMWAAERFFGTKVWVQVLSMILGLAACYTVGTAWFLFVYLRNTGAVSLMTVLLWCVIPFIVPDLVKIVLALMLGRSLRKPLSGIMQEDRRKR